MLFLVVLRGTVVTLRWGLGVIEDGFLEVEEDGCSQETLVGVLLHEGLDFALSTVEEVGCRGGEKTYGFKARFGIEVHLE